MFITARGWTFFTYNHCQFTKKKRKCQPTDVVTAFIAVIILWPFLSEIAKICVFSHGKCVKCLFAEASELECFCWSHSFMLSVKMRPTNGGFFIEAITPPSWFGCTSGRHCIMYDLLEFALATGGSATLSLPLLPEDRLRGLESLRPSSQSFCFRTEWLILDCV